MLFNDVVTLPPYTIEILQQALTFADELQPDLYLIKPSLMNMMKQAGYKTFWITNQQTMTKRNMLLTVLSQQTDEQFYFRYLEETTKFVGREGIPDGASDSDVEVYNDYDNAELYND
ncbi:MAG: sulfatase-like hydrolase/transferase [Symbiopectobacterium sp.]